MVLPWRATARKYFRSFQSNMKPLCTSAAGSSNPAAPATPGHPVRFFAANPALTSRQRRRTMRGTLACGAAVFANLAAASPALAQSHAPAAPDIAKPNLVLQQVVEGLPRDEKQTVRVMTATFKPGDKTVYHTHRFPVTVYVLEGAFTLELDGRAPITVKAGEALVEPPKVAMTGYNRSATEPTKVVIFYVSANDTPFLDLLH